jgi:small subunit ribosomal protein S1
MKVAIIDADQTGEKLIFSEKELKVDELKEKISKYKVGDVIEGEITGIVDFGIFIKIEEGLEGLAHVSQLDWGLIEDLQKVFKVGERVKAKIVEASDGKISLSLKALKPDPWQDIEEKYKKGDIAKGVVIRIDRYGALVSLEEGIGGLVHLSEFGSEETMRKKIEIGKSYPFQIALIDGLKRKLILSYIEEGK